MTLRLLVATCASLALLSLFGGCGKGNSPVAPVSGTVTYRGQPLKQGAIQFFPAEGRSASGDIVDGRIERVTTFRPKDGAPIGTCKVAIQAVQNAGDMYADHKSLIPDRYANPATSGLTAEIKRGGDPLKFDLTD